MKKTCDGCYFEHKRQCYWFRFVQNSKQKIIPPDTFNKGCSKYKNNHQNAKSDLIETVVNKFDGEIIGDKYTPRPFYFKQKKKSYTTRHKYTERRDAQ